MKKRTEQKFRMEKPGLWVKDLETACTVANELIKEGVNCIELCGGFGSAGAKAIIEATGNEIPIGYITHLPEQDELYAKVFSKK